GVSPSLTRSRSRSRSRSPSFSPLSPSLLFSLTPRSPRVVVSCGTAPSDALAGIPANAIAPVSAAAAREVPRRFILFLLFELCENARNEIHIGPTRTTRDINNIIHGSHTATRQKLLKLL